MTSTIGVPIKLLGEAQGHTVSIELTTGQTFRGRLLEAEDNMNVQLKDVTVTARDGRVSHLDQVYVRGSTIRFFIVPDMLRNAPMFRSRAQRGRGVGLARGRATVNRARGGGSMRGREEPLNPTPRNYNLAANAGPPRGGGNDGVFRFELPVVYAPGGSMWQGGNAHNNPDAQPVNYHFPMPGLGTLSSSSSTYQFQAPSAVGPEGPAVHRGRGRGRGARGS